MCRSSRRRREREGRNELIISSENHEGQFWACLHRYGVRLGKSEDTQDAVKFSICRHEPSLAELGFLSMIIIPFILSSHIQCSHPLFGGFG